MTVDRSRGGGCRAVGSSANRIKDGIPPEGLDTVTPERDASPDNTPAGRGFSLCV